MRFWCCYFSSSHSFSLWRARTHSQWCNLRQEYVEMFLVSPVYLFNTIYRSIRFVSLLFFCLFVCYHFQRWILCRRFYLFAAINYVVPDQRRQKIISANSIIKIINNVDVEGNRTIDRYFYQSTNIYFPSIAMRRLSILSFEKKIASFFIIDIPIMIMSASASMKSKCFRTKKNQGDADYTFVELFVFKLRWRHQPLATCDLRQWKNLHFFFLVGFGMV